MGVNLVHMQTDCLPGKSGNIWKRGNHCLASLSTSTHVVLRLLVRHFQEQQKRQLLHVVTIRKAVIPQDIAIIPELLNELGGMVRHSFSFVAGAYQVAGPRWTLPPALAFVWTQRVIRFASFELFPTGCAFDDVNQLRTTEG